MATTKKIARKTGTTKAKTRQAEHVAKLREASGLIRSGVMALLDPSGQGQAPGFGWLATAAKKVDAVAVFIESEGRS